MSSVQNDPNAQYYTFRANLNHGSHASTSREVSRDYVQGSAFPQESGSWKSSAALPTAGVHIPISDKYLHLQNVSNELKDLHTLPAQVIQVMSDCNALLGRMQSLLAMHSEMTKSIIAHSVTSTPSDTFFSPAIPHSFVAANSPYWGDQGDLFGGVEYIDYGEVHRGFLPGNVPSVQ